MSWVFGKCVSSCADADCVVSGMVSSIGCGVSCCVIGVSGSVALRLKVMLSMSESTYVGKMMS